MGGTFEYDQYKWVFALHLQDKMASAVPCYVASSWGKTRRTHDTLSKEITRGKLWRDSARLVWSGRTFIMRASYYRTSARYRPLGTLNPRKITQFTCFTLKWTPSFTLVWSLQNKAATAPLTDLCQDCIIFRCLACFEFSINTVLY